MADDHDALLARADEHQPTDGYKYTRCVWCHHKWPCETADLAAALRESQANYLAALDDIAYLTRGFDARCFADHQTWHRSPILADDNETTEEPMSDRQWAVYTHAAQRATGTDT